MLSIGKIGMNSMELRLNKKNINMEMIVKLLFYLALLLELIIVIVDKSDYINPIEGQLFRITFLLAAGKLILTKYSLKEWLCIAAFGLLGVVSYKVTGRNEILRIVVFIAACKNIELRKMFSFVFYITLGGCLLLMVLSLTGIYGNLYLEADFGRGIFERRYCIGMGHPNALHCMFFMLTLLGLYLYEKRMKWYQFLIVFLLNFSLFLLTDSKTGMLITTAAVGLTVIFHYCQPMKDWKWIYLAGILLFLSCVLLSIAASHYGLTKPFLQKMDFLLNGRILDLYWGSQAHEGTTAWWSLFSAERNTYYFDMGYVRVFYWYGIIPAVIYFLLNMILIWECYKKRDYMGLVIMTVLAVYTIVEAHIISVYIGRNYILLLLGAYWNDMLCVKNETKEAYLWKGYQLLS